MISFLRQCSEHILIDVTQHIQRWVKPNNPSLFADAALDLTRSKTELILENAFLRQQLIVLNRQVKRPAIKPHEAYTAGGVDQQAAVLDTDTGHRAT